MRSRMSSTGLWMRIDSLAVHSYNNLNKFASNCFGISHFRNCYIAYCLILCVNDSDLQMCMQNRKYCLHLLLCLQFR